MGFLALALLLAGNLQADRGPAPPEPVVNGTDALVCEFPGAASILRTDGSHACTVITVHPRVVLLAAHCLYSGELDEVVFGENAFAPAAAIPIENCEHHPGFMEIEDANLLDVAYCTLTDDAPAVPIVPPIMGCEAEQLVPGATVVLPGYGLNDEMNYTGQGTKRWTTNTIEAVDEKNNDLLLLGSDGASVCFGDSGGPAYFQLADGTWRVVGITSEGHPDVEGQELICGYGAVYDLVHLEMEWLESASGYDITPCFDAIGTWTADDSCGAFPLSLTTAGLDWSTACATDELSEWSATCGDPYQESGTSTGTGSDTGDESTTTDASSSSGAPEPDTTTSSSSDDSTSGPPLQLDGSDSTGAPPESGDSGCGCRNGSPSSLAFVLVLVTCRARRRRRSAARGSCS